MKEVVQRYLQSQWKIGLPSALCLTAMTLPEEELPPPPPQQCTARCCFWAEFSTEFSIALWMEVAMHISRRHCWWLQIVSVATTSTTATHWCISPLGGSTIRKRAELFILVHMKHTYYTAQGGSDQQDILISKHICFHKGFNTVSMT